MHFYSTDVSHDDARVLCVLRSLIIPAPRLVPEKAVSPYALDERAALREVLEAIDAGARRPLRFYLGSALAPTADERAVLCLLADGQAACHILCDQALQNLQRRAEWLVRCSFVDATVTATLEAGARLFELGIILSSASAPEFASGAASTCEEGKRDFYVIEAAAG